SKPSWRPSGMRCWTVPANWTGTAVASYDVQHRDGAGGSWTGVITATTAMSTTFAGQDGHAYSFRAHSRTTTGAVGDWSDPVSTTVDLTPPTGTLQAQGWSSPYVSNTIALSLAASDATSGVSQMQFGSDGQSYNPWQTYAITSPYTLALGATTVYARFRDKAGNVSTHVSATVPLDATPPGTPQPDDGVSGTSNNPRSTFRWTAVTDDVSGVEWYYYKVDSGPEFLTAGTVVTSTTQSDGDHTFSVRAKDRAANYSPYGSHAFSINNNLPPSPTISQPQTPTASDRTVVSGTSGPGLTVKLYVNGSLLSQTSAGDNGSWSFANVPLATGANVLFATNTNQAGNTSLPSTPVVMDRVTVWGTPPAPQASAVISATGGTVAAANSVTVTVPAGALPEEVVLSLTPYAAASAPGASAIFSANAHTSITAVATFSGGRVITLEVPVTVTIAYIPALLGNVPESILQVSYYDEATSQWVALPSVVDTVNHTVSASTTHFSVYNVQILPVQTLYLPLLLKRYSGW
ncbi:MAG: hypothetical protein Q8R28_09365, partial [Dehalococcoidia bacterium]|nr:hypothetical protein [Dehalococcoidia bacterium]